MSRNVRKKHASHKIAFTASMLSAFTLLALAVGTGSQKAVSEVTTQAASDLTTVRLVEFEPGSMAGVGVQMVPLAAGVFPLEAGQAAIIMFASDGDATALPSGENGSVQQLLVPVTGRQEHTLYGFGKDQLPAWLVIYNDGTLAHRHFGPISVEQYATWVSLLAASTPNINVQTRE